MILLHIMYTQLKAFQNKKKLCILNKTFLAHIIYSHFTQFVRLCFEGYTPLLIFRTKV